LSGYAHTIITAAVLIGFAALVTAHVAIVYGLLGARRLGLAVATLVVPPLAPWVAVRDGMSVRAAVWLGAAVIYAVGLVFAW
jgi:hypothetical protein